MVQRRWIEAERWLNLEIAGYPEGALAYYKKAEIQLFGLGDLAGTEAVLQEGSQKVESFSTTYYRVNAALYAKDYKKALNLVEADPVRPYYWKAQILELMGRQDEARSEYEAASHAYEDLLRERPEQPFFHTALGFIYAKLGRRDAALSHANRARKLRSLLSDPWASGEDILFQVAWILVALSENEEAIDHLETLLSLRCLVTKPRLRLEPYFIPLHDHPRFTALVSD
jgi:tetratricopeptide (TPR) repeat protein